MKLYLRKLSLYVAIFVLGMVAIPVLRVWGLEDAKPARVSRQVPPPPYKAPLYPNVAPEDIAYIQLGGYEYAMPKLYLDRSSWEENCHSSTALLLFKPLTHDQFAQPVWPPLPKHNPLEVGVVSLLMHTNIHSKKDLYTLLEGYFESRRSGYSNKYYQRPDPFYGLTLFVPQQEGGVDAQPPGQYRNYRDHLLASYDDKGVLRSFLACSPPGTTKNPGCSHYFVIGDAEIKLHYNLKFLYLWKEIESGFTRLIRSWQLGPIQTRLPPCCEAIECFIPMPKKPKEK
jgi:hypothetical protein